MGISCLVKGERELKKIHYVVFIGFFVVFVIICLRDSSDLKMFATTQTLTMFNDKPYLLSDDAIYEYKAERNWKKVEKDVAVKQIIDGEIPCAIDTNGKILCEELPDQEENLPLSSAYAYDMARQCCSKCSWRWRYRRNCCRSKFWVVHWTIRTRQGYKYRM